jgi:hypothetical protein
METSASFEARSAPLPYPVEHIIRALQGFNSSETQPTSFISGSSPKSYDRGQRSTGAVTAFGVVVRIEQFSTASALALIQQSQIPANANNSPSLTSKE